MDKTLKTRVAIICATVTTLVFAVLYWQYLSAHPTTEDAYVNSHRATISSQVTGKVAAVHVVDNQFVKKGELLFDIDPKPFLITRDKLRAQLQLTQQAVNVNTDGVDAAQSKVEQARAVLNKERKNAQRFATLSAQGKVSKAEADSANTAFKVAEGNFAAMISALRQSQQTLGKTGKENAALRVALALSLIHI